MQAYWLGIIGACATLVFVFEMLRRGILKERFAALWLIVSVSLLVVAVFPRILSFTAGIFGVEIAANFLFFVAIIFLLLVAVQLSFEVSRLEARTRRLAEDMALLRWELHNALPRDNRCELTGLQGSDESGNEVRYPTGRPDQQLTSEARSAHSEPLVGSPSRGLAAEGSGLRRAGDEAGGAGAGIGCPAPSE